MCWVNVGVGAVQTGKAFSSLPSVQVLDNEESNQVCAGVGAV